MVLFALVLVEQFFVGAQTVVSLLQTTQIKQGVSFIAANKGYLTKKLLVSWQFSGPYGVTKYGSGWRKDVVNQCLEFAQKVDPGEENSPAASAGIRTRDLSITSPVL